MTQFPGSLLVKGSLQIRALGFTDGTRSADDKKGGASAP